LLSRQCLAARGAMPVFSISQHAACCLNSYERGLASFALLPRAVRQTPNRRPRWLAPPTRTWNRRMNRDGVHQAPGRLLEAEVASSSCAGGGTGADESWTSDEHFTWMHFAGSLAGAKSFQRKDGKRPPRRLCCGNPTVNFHGERRSTGRMRRRRSRGPVGRKGEGKRRS